MLGVVLIWTLGLKIPALLRVIIAWELWGIGGYEGELGRLVQREGREELTEVGRVGLDAKE